MKKIILFCGAFVCALVNHIAFAQDDNDVFLNEIEQGKMVTARMLNENFNNLKNAINSLNLQLKEQRPPIKEQRPPIGAILLLASPKIPNGYILCDGRDLKITEYRELFSVIGTIWGGDGVSTFKIPDLRGVFPRFYDAGKGLDADRKFGQAQNDATRIPEHLSIQVAGTHAHAISKDEGHVHKTNDSGLHSHGNSVNGGHRHNVNGFDNVLKYDKKSTVKEMDDFDHPGTREPNLQYSEPMAEAGSHQHSIHDAGRHAHETLKGGLHSHESGKTGDHTHVLKGGDKETRPINHALYGFMRYE